MVLALTLTLVLALVRDMIIFSKVRVLVLNQPIIIVHSSSTVEGKNIGTPLIQNHENHPSFGAEFRDESNAINHST